MSQAGLPIAGLQGTVAVLSVVVIRRLPVPHPVLLAVGGAQFRFVLSPPEVKLAPRSRRQHRPSLRDEWRR